MNTLEYVQHQKERDFRQSLNDARSGEGSLDIETLADTLRSEMDNSELSHLTSYFLEVISPKS